MKNLENNKKNQPKGYGLSIAFSFWIWGVLFLITPDYFNITTWPKEIFSIIGWAFITISFGGSMLELSKIINNEGFNQFGISLVFLIPALILFFTTKNAIISRTLIVFLKIITLLFTAIGVPFLFGSVPYFLKKNQRASTSINNQSKNNIENYVEEKTKIESSKIINIFTAILSLITAIITFIIKFKG